MEITLGHTYRWHATTETLLVYLFKSQISQLFQFFTAFDIASNI